MRRNTRRRLYLRGFHGILSGHVSIGRIPDTFLFRSTFPSRYSNGFHRRRDVVSRERTELSMSRMYSCTTATSWRITTGHCYCATASFSISRPRNSKAAVIIRKAACRSQVGTRGPRHANPGAVLMQVSVATSSVISFAIKRL